MGPKTAGTGLEAWILTTYWRRQNRSLSLTAGTVDLRSLTAADVDGCWMVSKLSVYTSTISFCSQFVLAKSDDKSRVV